MSQPSGPPNSEDPDPLLSHHVYNYLGGGVSEWRVVRRRSSAFSEREREETGVPGGMTASV